MRFKGEDTLSLQSILFKKMDSVLEYELSLTKEDIYKELGMKGYHLSGQFTGLNEIRTNFQEYVGVIQWGGSVIPFLDTLLQTILLLNPF